MSDEIDEVDDEDEQEAEEATAAAPARPRSTLFSRSHTTLEAWEQKAAFALGGLTIVVGLGGWITKGIDEGKGEDFLFAAIGLVVGTLFILAARSGRRLLTAFASLLANFAQSPWRAAAFLQFSCVILGGLIILRTSNEAARRAGEERRRRRQEEKAARGGRPVRGGARPTAKATGKGAGPTPSKRYTPPKPKPKKRPPPPTEKGSASKRSEETP